MSSSRTQDFIRIRKFYINNCNSLKRLTDIAYTHRWAQLIMEGKFQKDGRENRPIYIITNNKRTLAVADGKGHAYKVYGEGYEVFNSVCKPENKYDPNDYEFERGLSGMDF